MEYRVKGQTSPTQDDETYAVKSGSKTLLYKKKDASVTKEETKEEQPADYDGEGDYGDDGYGDEQDYNQDQQDEDELLR
ncbi:MAG: hypothetical protein VXZ35_09675 [Pseudomonadota bacterium]|nr:hypothetical protein [Pseudomonadota bacterium]